MGDKKGEDSPFISSKKPVTLNPSWESQMQPDTNGKGSGSVMSKIVASLQPPIDKYKIVFYIFLLHGVGTLMPWNMFITAKSYYEDFKLSENFTVKTETKYNDNFMQNMTFASQIPNVLFNWINIFINLGGDLTNRIVYSILMEIAILIFTVILAMLDSSEWPGVFFWVSMSTFVLINMCNGIYQSTIYGLVASLPPKYTGAVVLGSNISGCFATIMSMLCSAFFTSIRTSAIYYFVTAIVVMLVCFDTYFALPLNKFFRHFELVSKQNEKSSGSKQELKVPYWQIFKKASPQLFNVCLTMFVTLAVFPSVYSDIKGSDDFFIGKKYFTFVTCFLTFNVFAMLGSLTTSWIQWPKPRFLVVPVVLRVAFIPLFIFCNYLPKSEYARTLPVFITNEWVYWIIGIIMSYSSGYLSSLAMMYAPQTVHAKYQVTAGMFAAAFLVTGIFGGVLFSYLNPLIIRL